MAGLPVNSFVHDVVQLHGHVVVDIADTLRNEPHIFGLAPNEEEERGVENLPPDGDEDDVGLAAKEGAPLRVVLMELAASTAGSRESGEAQRWVLLHERSWRPKLSKFIFLIFLSFGFKF